MRLLSIIGQTRQLYRIIQTPRIHFDIVGIVRVYLASKQMAGENFNFAAHNLILLSLLSIKNHSTTLKQLTELYACKRRTQREQI